MVLVVGAVKILAVPAGGEVVDGHDAGRAWLLGELGRLREPSHDVLQTGVAKAGVGPVRASWVPDGHTEALRGIC